MLFVLAASHAGHKPQEWMGAAVTMDEVRLRHIHAPASIITTTFIEHSPALEAGRHPAAASMASGVEGVRIAIR